MTRTSEVTNTGRSDNFDVLKLTESDLEVEWVNEVDGVQEIVEITVDSGAATSVWTI